MSKEQQRRVEAARTQRTALLGKGTVVLLGAAALVGWVLAIVS